MRRDTKPWPAFVDLFAALFIASFAGFILLTGKTVEQVQKEKIRVKVDSLSTQLENLLEGQNLKYKVRRIGDDVSIDLYIHFPTNSDVIRDPNDVKTIQQVGRQIKRSLEGLSPIERHDIEVVIEGHTDSRQPTGLKDLRQRFLYNWNLSSLRAISVLYEFKEVELIPPAFSVVAIGYADSKPRCTDSTPECSAENRRTTILLRVDMARIEKRLKGY